MGLLGSLLRFILFSTIIFLVILLIPNIPPHVRFTEFHVTQPKPLKGKLELNTLLNNAERMFENELKGPECFTVMDGELYTTLHGGYVAKIFEDQIVPVVKFGESCAYWWEESKCGRPLGLRATNDKHLIVADAYYGIYKYNVDTGKSTLLVDKSVVIEGKKPQIFNSVEVAKDGTIYWTDSSSDFLLQDGIYSLLADGSGRLIKYDPKTQRNLVLLDGLQFANGVALSPDEDFVLVAETGHSRIHRYYLKGPRKHTSDIFIDGLPGLPDNLRPNGRGGFFVPLVMARDDKTPVISQSLGPFPAIRKVLARILALFEGFFEQIEKIYPNYFAKRSIHFIGHFEALRATSPLRTTILEVDVNGNIIESYHALDGSVSGISDVIVHKGSLYLGSPFNEYLGRVKLHKLGGKLKEPSPTMTPRSTTTTTPKPTTTTTTPKPATTTTTPKPTTTTTTPKPTTTTTTPKPTTTTTTPKPTTSTTTQKPKTTAPKPTPTTPKPTTATPKPTATTSKPKPTPKSTENKTKPSS